jgi:RNA polymerase sigma-70 factor (ECF subfamily)
MKKNYETYGSEGKGNGRAWKVNVVGDALRAYLSGKSPEAWQFAYSLCRDVEEADELLQEACYRVLRESRRYDPSRPVKSWLFTILRNAFTDSRRSRRWRDSRSLDHHGGEGETFLHEIIAGKDECLSARLERQDRAARVRAVLARLQPRHRDVLTLCDAKGMSYKAAAKALRLNMGTLRSRLHRARAKFRSSAGRHGLE